MRRMTLEYTQSLLTTVDPVISPIHAYPGVDERLPRPRWSVALEIRAAMPPWVNRGEWGW